jgi:flavonol synthase
MEFDRVQTIASLSFDKEAIPEEFIMPEKEQPAITTFRGLAPEIPAIDLSDPDQEKLVGLIADASKEWGIFQVINHGIPSDLIAELQGAGKKFFELPQEEKEVCARPRDSKSIEGYDSKLQKDPQEKKSWVDHLFHRIWPPPSINYQFWPENPPSYRSVFYHLIKLGKKILKNVLHKTQLLPRKD